MCVHVYNCGGGGGDVCTWWDVVCIREGYKFECVWKTVKICYTLCLMQVRCGSGSSRKGGDEEKDCFCGCCGCLYESETEESEIWIECGRWFHCRCEGLSTPPPEVDYICLQGLK